MLEEIVEFSTVLGYSLLLLFKSMIASLIPNKFRHKDVSNDIVLITGAGSGFGRELAIRFAKLGSKVVAWDNNPDGLAETEKIFKSKGLNCKSYVCDITDRNAVYSTAETVKSEVGIVSILINNAGVVFGGKFMSVSDEHTIKLFHVNALSHFWTIKAFLPDMRNQKKGHVVAVASIAGVGGSVALSAYCATKHAVVGLQESLSLESYFEGDYIKFTTICPFFMDTGMFKGVSTKLIPILDPSHTADTAMNSILLEKEIVFMPRWFYFVYPLKAMLPFTCIKPFYGVAKNEIMMDTFVGRAHNNN